MHDPYAVLGVPADADDATIRGRYLTLVKQFTPESHPERFAAIRQAYELLKDAETRLRGRLFEVGKHENVANILEELACRSSRRRMSLTSLLAMAPKS
jgi:curved DNA-binding protein CbpA